MQKVRKQKRLRDPRQLERPAVIVTLKDAPAAAQSRRVLWAVLLLNALLLAPLLRSPYCMDDVVNSQIRGILIQGGMGLWQFTAVMILHWTRTLGRVFPLAFLSYPLFYFCQSLIVYKCLVYALALLDVWVFYRLVKHAGQSTTLAALAAALFPLFIQFRAAEDPLLSFSCLYPLLAFLLLSSLLLFSQYLERPSPRLLGFSVLLFWLSTLIFEVVYPLSALYIVIPWRQRKSIARALRAAAPFLAIDAAMVAVTLYFRSRASGLRGSNYAIQLSPAAVLQAFAAQIAGVIPLSYGAFDPGNAIATAVRDGNAWFALTFSVLGAVLGLFWMLRRTLRSLESVRLQPGILATGLVLLFAPPILICFSSKYQQFTVANSYLPIYLSCFGGSLLLSMAILRFLPKLPAASGRWILPLFLVFAATGYAWSFRNNVLVVDYLNRLDFGRSVARAAAAKGFFSGLGESGLIFTPHQLPWELDSFFAQASGHRQTLLGLQDAADDRAILISAGAHCSPQPQYDVCAIAPEGSVFFFRVQPVGPRSTALILSRIKTVVLELGLPRALTAADTDVFLSGPTQGHPPFSLAVRGTSGETDFWLNAGPPKFQGSGWQWFQIRENGAEATSLNVYLEAAQPPALPPLVASLPASRLKLQSTLPALVHVGYDRTNWGEGAMLRKLPTKLPLSIELVVTPSASQAPFATILSNHGAFGGLTIEQEGGESNRYQVAIGTGAAYEKLADISLLPARRHYLAVELQPGAGEVYLDGQLQSRQTIPAAIGDSGLPLRLGNWAAGGRSFSGQIEELLIAPEVHSAADIQARAAALGVSR